MNHRELVLSARKKAKFGFLALPEDLQDELIDGLDSHTLTLEGARDFLRERGHVLSHEAIAGYYRAVRRERRLLDATQELTRVVETFADQPLEDNVRTLTNFLIATAMQKLADGAVGIKDVDIGRVIGALTAMEKAKSSQPPVDKGGISPRDGAGAEAGSKKQEAGLDPEMLRKIREEVYGIVA